MRETDASKLARLCASAQRRHLFLQSRVLDDDVLVRDDGGVEQSTIVGTDVAGLLLVDW